MKKYFLAATVLFAGCISQAQQPENPGGDNKMKDYDEIIIKRKDSTKEGKVVIELRNQEVLVDGKPINEYNGDDFIIRKHRPNHYTLSSPSSQFRLNGNSWSMDNGDQDMGNPAFLGVLTEGSSQGTKVIKVSENSAAEEAGLKNGDLILKINDKAVFDHEELSKAIASKKPGEKITITYKRDGKENKTTATLGKREYHTLSPRGSMPYGAPGMPPMGFNFDGNGLQGFFHAKPRLGIKAQDTEEGKGVKVIDVDKDSPADKAGIKEEDIITSFEGKEVNSADDLARISQQSNDKPSVKVQLKRNGKSQNIDIKLPKKLKTANI